MPNKKVSFIKYYDDREKLASLNDEEYGKLERMVENYAIDGIIPVVIPEKLQIAFWYRKVQIDIDTKKWELECEARQRAGYKTAAKRWGYDKNSIGKRAMHSNAQQHTATHSVGGVAETDNELDPAPELEHGTEINAGANLSQNQIKFQNAFPNLEVDGDLLPEQSIDILIAKIKESPWLQNRKNLGLKWYAKPKNYKKVVNDYYSADNFDQNNENGGDDIGYLDE